jgi:transposase
VRKRSRTWKGETMGVSRGETIGIDLGDRYSDVCILDESGTEVRRERIATTESGLKGVVQGRCGVRVVMEVGTHSPWISRLFESFGHEVIVASAARVRQIAGKGDKTDRKDAELLARLGRVDPQVLEPIKHRGESVQRDRALLRVRDGLVRTRASLVTQARCIAKSLGKRLPRCDAQNFAKRMDRDDLRELFPGLERLREVVGELSRQIGALDVTIEEVSRQKYPETARLRQITGVGPITALTYVVTIEDPKRFSRSRSVGAYLGLKPKKHQSGEQDPELRITKAGDPYLRRTLVQAAHYILGHHGPDTALRRFGERVKNRGARKTATKRAAIAVARKLAVLLHRLWVSGENYEPLRGVEQASAA